MTEGIPFNFKKDCQIRVCTRKNRIKGSDGIGTDLSNLFKPQRDTCAPLFPASVFKCSLNFQVHIITDEEPKRLKCRDKH